MKSSGHTVQGPMSGATKSGFLKTAVAATAFLASASFAWADGFVLFDGIKGESRDEKHRAWTEIESAEFSIEQSGSSMGGGAGVGKTSFSEFKFSKRADLGSTALMEAAATGKRIKSAVIEFAKNGPRGTVFYKVTLGDVTVSRFVTKLAGPNAQEEIALRFRDIRVVQFTMDDKGATTPSPEFAWDIQKNSKP